MVKLISCILLRVQLKMGHIYLQKWSWKILLFSNKLPWFLPQKEPSCPTQQLSLVCSPTQFWGGGESINGMKRTTKPSFSFLNIEKLFFPQLASVLNGTFKPNKLAYSALTQLFIYSEGIYILIEFLFVYWVVSIKEHLCLKLIEKSGNRLLNKNLSSVSFDFCSFYCGTMSPALWVEVVVGHILNRWGKKWF